jgi:hypothetical protein
MKEKELLALPRKKLQSLAKEHGINANLASSKLVEELMNVDNSEHVKQKAQASRKVEKEVTAEVEDVKVMSTSEPSSSSSSCSSSGVVEIPLYWGSVLEGASDPRAAYEQATPSSQ